MVNEFELYKQYQRTCDLAYKKEKWVYSLEWLFVKNLIKNAYKLDRELYLDDDNDNINVNLINNNINSESVREILHSIRNNRNIYEHKDINVLKVPNINEIKNELDIIINYINNNNIYNYQFIGKYQAFQIEKDERQDSLNKIFEIEEEKYSYTVYNNAYAREDKYFLLDTFVDKCKNPIFAVIHNLLIRSDNIKLNNLLLKENLDLTERQEVYKFQIALLTLLAKNYSNQFNIIVSLEDEKIAKIALKNIMYYYEIISRMTKTKEDFLFNLSSSKKIINNRIKVNSDIIQISDIDVDTQFLKDNSHVFLSNIELNYEINNKNIKYYNILLNELFEIEEFRKGQIETITEFLKDNKPLMSILPTGYGKSLIYQFIALIYPKIMWIVSPNEFLVNDQRSNLIDKNIYRSSYITDIGTINPQIELNLNKIPIFRSNINYIIAEGILSNKILKILQNLIDENYVSAISIDECHKTSIWSHQFSSKYATLIRQLRDELSNCKFLLLSATVATRVQKEIKGQINNLKIIQPCTLKRDNIKFDIKKLDTIKNIVDYIEKRYNESSNLSIEISDLSIVVNNDERVLSEIMEQLKKRKGLLDKCYMFDGTIKSYEEFKIQYRGILFVTDDYLTGININNLNNLFIIGMPISKEWLYQQSGRVGRYLKDGFVSVLLLNEDNTFINNMVNNIIKPLSDLEMQSLINHTNLTELLYSIFEYDETIINRTNDIVKEIKNCIFVPSGKKYGSVIGRIPDGMFGVYDMPIYLLLYMSIIKSVKYLQEKELDITYRILVEPEPEKWFAISKSKIYKNILYESYDERIKKDHINELENAEKVEDIVKIVLHWLSFNNLRLKNEMFKNIYKLIIQNVDNTDTDNIENDLTNYFSVGSFDIEYELESIDKYSNEKEEIVESITKLDFNDRLLNNKENTKHDEVKNIFYDKEENNVKHIIENNDEKTVQDINNEELDINDDINSNQIFDLKIENSINNKVSANTTKPIKEKVEIENNINKEEIFDEVIQKNGDSLTQFNEEENIPVETRNMFYNKDNITNYAKPNYTEKIIKDTDNKEFNNNNNNNNDYKNKEEAIDYNRLASIVNDEIEKALEKQKITQNDNETLDKTINMSYINKQNDKLDELLKINPENIEIIINIVKEDIIKYNNELKAHIERHIENQYSKICLIALCIYELFDIKEKSFFRLKELNQEDRILFYSLLNKIKEEIDLNRMFWIDNFLIDNKYAFSFIPLKYYDFYKKNEKEIDIIHNISAMEERISYVEDILKCFYNEGNYYTALKALAIIEINYKKIFSLIYFEKLVESSDYKNLLEIENCLLTKKEKIAIDELLKKKNEEKFYYRGILGLFKRIFEKDNQRQLLLK